MSMNPTFVAALFAFLCVAAFLIGLRFYRMAEPPEGTTVQQARRFGRLLMMASVAMFLFLIGVIAHGDFGVIREAKAIR